MEVRDEDVRQAVEADMQAAHLQLRALAAIHEVGFVVYVNDLRRGLVPHRGRGRAAAEYGDVEAGHGVKNGWFVNHRQR